MAFITCECDVNENSQHQQFAKNHVDHFKHPPYRAVLNDAVIFLVAIAVNNFGQRPLGIREQRMSDKSKPLNLVSRLLNWSYVMSFCAC